MRETWKPTPGFEGVYEVSDLGRVRRILGGRGAVAGKVLADRPNKKGYLSVYISKMDGDIQITKNATIHRLVLLAFVGPPPTPKHTANHKSGIKKDNRPQNLEWVTNQENITHSWKMGLRKYIGEAHYKAKLTNEQVQEIRASKHQVPQRVLAKRYGISLTMIKCIHMGKNWKHITTPFGQPIPRTHCPKCGEHVRPKKMCLACHRRISSESYYRRKFELAKARAHV